MKYNLQTIPSSQINSQKWDACVAKHKAPIYCSFIYLNTMADNWFGIVVNDYEAIMPVCYRKKMGIVYSYVPSFMQQLGWIGNANIDWIAIEKAVLSFVNYGDIMLNHNNHFEAINHHKKSNLIIDLSKPHTAIYENYKTDLKQNLKKAAKEQFVYQSSNNIHQAINLYQAFYANRMNGLSKADFKNFKTLCETLANQNNCLVREVLNNNNELLAIALLLKDENRIYNLANSTTDLGRKSEANHFLIDRILKEFSNTNLIFDFEGSDLPGVKQFYQKFGAIDEPYFHWHFNNLPWWIKWAKK
jgi:hypothetical protein